MLLKVSSRAGVLQWVSSPISQRGGGGKIDLVPGLDHSELPCSFTGYSWLSWSLNVVDIFLWYITIFAYTCSLEVLMV